MVAQARKPVVYTWQSACKHYKQVWENSSQISCTFFYWNPSVTLFLYFIIWTNKIQRLLALPELFIAVIFENMTFSAWMQAILLILFPRTILLISIIISSDWLLFILRKSYWFHWGSVRLWTFTDAGLYSWQLLMDLFQPPLVSSLQRAFLSRPTSSITVSPRGLCSTH